MMLDSVAVFESRAEEIGLEPSEMQSVLAPGVMTYMLPSVLVTFGTASKL